MRIARSLEAQVAWITGGGKGIGRAIALELAAQGACVLVTGREERALGETVGEVACAGGKARHLVGDVRDESHARAAATRAIETWGRLDVVVANAGLAGTTLLGQSNDAAIGHDGELEARGSTASAQTGALARAIVETNLLGAYYAFDAALACMQGPGRLVAISSVLGKFGAPGQAAYCASKAGLHGLVRAVALDVGRRGITCNAVCPGWVDTEMARGRIAGIASSKGIDYQTAAGEAAKALPIGRFVEPAEVARFVSFLCSTAADTITGQALSICAGATVFAG
jgi:NAD(P)-dependent dehydrogenase (short-subunit alcohol dehydrogenase family)